jgi:hypothetical protein
LHWWRFTVPEFVSARLPGKPRERQVAFGSTRFSVSLALHPGRRFAGRHFMATVHSISGPPSAGGSGPRGSTYQVTTRELSADFASVGPDQSSRELGAIDGATFLRLLEKLVAIDALTLVDADPQLFVTVKSGRFLIQPQGGKLLVRPTNALDQIFFKLSPAEIPPFLDGVPFAAPTPSPTTTLIGSAAARADAASVDGRSEFRGRSRLRSDEKVRPWTYVQRPCGRRARGRGGGWFFFLRPPAPAPVPRAATTSAPRPTTPSTTAARSPDFDPISSPVELSNLQKRFAGTYATSGDAGERMLELRADGTFRYQEFGASLAVTKARQRALHV